MSAGPLQRAALRLDGLSLRERVLIFVSALTAVLLGWYQFAMTPVLRSGEAALVEIDAARERIDAADTAVRAQSEQLRLGTGPTLDDQLEATRRRTSEVDAQIDARAADIVDPAKMARVLEDLLARHSGLRLVRARNLPAHRIEESDEAAPLYRHTLRMEVEGPYLALLSYVERLEALPWRIYWQGIEIDASDYPRNRVRIDVSTLSFEEDWIGV